MNILSLVALFFTSTSWAISVDKGNVLTNPIITGSGMTLPAGSTIAVNGGVTISTASSPAGTAYQNMLRYDDTELAIRRNTSPMLSLYRANGTQSASLDASGGTLSLLARENGAPIIIDNPGQSQAIRIDAEGSICINCTDAMSSLHVVSTSNAVGADIFRADGPAATRLFAVKTDTTVFMASGSTWTFGANGVIFSTATTGPLTSGIGGNIVLMDSGVGIGDPSPDARLDVTGVAGDTNVLDISSNNATSLLKVAQAGQVTIASYTVVSGVAHSSPTANSLYSDNLIKAWVRFNQGTDAITGSYNVNSITNVSAGVDQVNFGTAFANTNYGGIASDQTQELGDCTLGTYNTGSVRVLCYNGSAAAADSTDVMVIILGTQ